jgi:hypothetical protein
MARQSGEDGLVVEGDLQDLDHPSKYPGVLSALDAKYSDPSDSVCLPSRDPAFDGIYQLVPRPALSWQLADFDCSLARWTHPGQPPGNDVVNSVRAFGTRAP